MIIILYVSTMNTVEQLITVIMFEFKMSPDFKLLANPRHGYYWSMYLSNTNTRRHLTSLTQPLFLFECFFFTFIAFFLLASSAFSLRAFFFRVSVTTSNSLFLLYLFAVIRARENRLNEF